MSVHVIRMPDLGEGIAEVELVAWHVKPSDAVTEDQVLADVMTDKATVEIPSPVAGQVLALGGEVGEMLAVGADLIRIELAGVPAAAAASATRANPMPSPASAPGPAVPLQSPTPVPIREPPSAAPARSASHDRPIASPALRARAWELGVDLQAVPASGPAGRVMQSDLDAYLARNATRSLPSAPPQRHDLPDATATHAEKIVGLRRKIAQKMQEAKRRIPHFTYVEEIDVTELETLRARLNAQWGAERGRLTLLPLVARAIVLAVREFPQVNARFDDDAGIVTRYGAVHIGIATQTDAGLLVPVLRHAEARDLWSSAAEIARLADATRTAKAVREELSGSTITITSLGALGGIVTTPVINHPEVAIVGVNRIVERPMMRGGAVVPRLMMNLSSSFDHRVVDGAVAARFVQALRGLLECPATLFVE